MSCSITLKNVSYKNENTSLFENINLNVGHEEKIAIIGSNGVGKSTLLKIIAGIESSFDGTLELFHNPIKSKNDYKKFRFEVGYLPQDISSFFLCPTVIEDVMFSLRTLGTCKDEARTKALEILKELDILHLENRVIYELSGGEQKIVALAGILIKNPKILLLDEPTNALDEQTQNKIIDILNSQKKSMIIISHHKSFIEKLAPTIYKLENKSLNTVF
ncbi:energy-coupling factor ABC transporter ATP-binding protein [Aliarcobacter butzleri]|uniref:energy-coupling factor ABC transporter ATP-binding protein n=1 Tax=Aliarcobacter butzleri TaxID=28197 RepID=UPI0021B26EAB|nr:ABC transporter ATP-binding protein [Aliarcobacter butzleri]MCT7549494.1 energy-coupling factor ABC transporter ATP-binding protein [Aliarcobacter butzleri]MCT7558180.1 energy-coupling factor ABC transporter ATP-binding protein [Aliarcobacter butzleri]MCT7625454.1 energy-coupling factor ABC transporter ATP-binding protein [Aliarcobacter butzleri]MCT7636035.1 energy-coupling factor ABC transporter ATP-binding protein [Aliarcobacter butzleri]MCT7642498.1 energy-coupling factor ABC transporter